MSLGHGKPPPSLLRELEEVAEAARALTEGIRAFNNVLPERFPKAGVLDICGTLEALPEGTAEGCRVPLEYARLRLPAIRREHIEQEDLDAIIADPDEPPPLLRGMGFDRQLRDLISSATTALDEYRSLAHQSWDDSVHAEPEIDSAGEPAIPAAIEQSGMTEAALLRTRAEIQEVAQPRSVKADTLGRTVSDAAGLTRLARAELRMPTVVLRWYKAVATTLSDYPRLIRRAGDAIDAGIDIAEPLRRRWNDFWSDVDTFLFRQLWAFADTCREIGEKLEQRRGSSFDELARHEAEREARRLILAGEPVPQALARLVRRLDLSGSDELKTVLPRPELVATLPSLHELTLFRVILDDLTPLSRLTGLTSLRLDANMADDLTPLSRLTGLTSLRLDTNMADDLSPLSGLTGLISLNLKANRAADLSPLSGLTQLTSLSLDAHRAADLSPLSGLTQLTSLSLDAHRAADLSSLSALASLTLLSLQANSAPDVSPLSALTGLTKLSLQAKSAEEISPLGGLKRLTTLSLQAHNVRDLSPLGGLTRLTSLSLHANSARDLSPLGGLKRLTTLSLQAHNARDLSPLANLTWLTSLSLHVNSARDFSPLGGLTRLTTLILQAESASDLSPLGGLMRLTSLSLHTRSVHDLEPLARLHRLEILRLDARDFPSRVKEIDIFDELPEMHRVAIDLTPVGRLPKLKRLIVRDVVVTDWSPVAHVPHVDRGEVVETP